MAQITYNTNAFCADYGSLAACLAAVQALKDSGAFNGNTQIADMLLQLENDLLKKLLRRTLTTLGIIDDVFDDQTLFEGDFEGFDFSKHDFFVGYLDASSGGFSNVFKTVLDIFEELCRRSAELSAAERAALNAVLIPVLDAIAELLEYLNAQGFFPCGEPGAGIYNNYPTGLHLQAAGSDGSDGSVAGIHLRWGFNGELGLNHLPKGQDYNDHGGEAPFNRADDFVTISRIPYTGQVRITLDLQNSIPAVDLLRGRWTYALNSVRDGKTISNRIRLAFQDKAQFHRLASHMDPLSAPGDLIKAYQGMLSVEVVEKAAFAIGLGFTAGPAGVSGQPRIEVISAHGPLPADEIASIRKVVDLNGQASASAALFGENIRRVNVQLPINVGLDTFSFETYADWLSNTIENDWTVIGDPFALSLDEETVFRRLEDTTRFTIDHSWPQYNDGTTVRVANYQDKWSVSRENDPSIATAVYNYITRSRENSRAEEDFPAIGGDPDTGPIRLSYVDMINLMATDFHIARMFGLGHIDIPAPDPDARFIYRAVYRNRLSAGDAEERTLTSCSIPTGTGDQRLPEKPELMPVTYGPDLGVDEALSQFDEHGYTPVENIRVINIRRMPADYENSAEIFFGGSGPQYDIFARARPVYYGIEYRAEGDTAYVLPEITTASFEGRHIYYAYNDLAGSQGVPEISPLTNEPGNLFLHLEDKEGVHYYAAYGINIFSRPSPLSDEVQTDETLFALKNHLTAPDNIAVQYIQKENTLLFTTQTEQDWLAARKTAFPGTDTNFTRVTFNYLDITDISYLPDQSAEEIGGAVRADHARVYFREQLPLQFAGIILNSIPVADHRLQLTAGGYQLLDGSFSMPLIPRGETQRFTGSLLNTEEGQFPIVSVAVLGEHLLITIDQIVSGENLGNDAVWGEDHFGVDTIYTSPVIGSRFTVIENLQDEAGWSAVQAQIVLQDLSGPEGPVIELQTTETGANSAYLVGGITASASVAPVSLAAGDYTDLPGYYKITFQPGISLLPHPQDRLPYDPADPGESMPGVQHDPCVQWYKGLVQLPLESADEGRRKLLEVVRIAQSSPLVLYAADPTYMESPVRLSAGSGDLIANVNFHPGYKVYFLSEPGPPSQLNGAHILPGPDENAKKTLLSLQTVCNRSDGTTFASPISAQVVLLARNVVEPVRPEVPMAAFLRVRPDPTAKAAFTFDTRVLPDAAGRLRRPFGFMYYRAGNEKVLRSLYEPETVEEILQTLSILSEDSYFSQRYLELVNVSFDPTLLGEFRVFDAQPAPYGFPRPDLPELNPGGATVEERAALYREAIRRILLPLTEQPPIFGFLKTGKQTENTRPVIKSIDGDFLSPGDPAFDPFPMVRKFFKDDQPAATFVRFTDYSLNASSRFLYFYATTELSGELVPGPLSPFAGPVSIVHTLPPETPSIINATLSTDPVSGESSVIFTLEPFAASEGLLYKARVFWAPSEEELADLTAAAYMDVEFVTDTTAVFEVLSPVSASAFIPWGGKLYYRLAIIRNIINERNDYEDVLSAASAAISVTFTDTVNPVAPEPTYTGADHTLHWVSTIYNGKYIVFQQNSRGNWQRLGEVSSQFPGATVSYQLSAPLQTTDGDGNTIYSRFKVKAENASGLLNLTDKEITV